jgi:hypothetical protein
VTVTGPKVPVQPGVKSSKNRRGMQATSDHRAPSMAEPGLSRLPSRSLPGEGPAPVPSPWA